MGPTTDARPTSSPSLPHGTHSGRVIARATTRHYIVSEHFYQRGLRADAHAHETAFLYAYLPRRCSHRVHTFEEPIIGIAPAGVEHPPIRVEHDGQLLHVDFSPHYLDGLIPAEMFRGRERETNHPHAVRLAYELCDALAASEPLRSFAISALVSEIGAAIVPLAHRDATLPPRWLKRIASEVEERYRHDLSLDDLAASVRMHPVHVSRMFRRCYGETLRSYVRRLRVHEGRRLLKTSGMTVAQVAAEVGYYDESHFSKAFKLVTGTTPGYYRYHLHRTYARPTTRGEFVG